MSKIVTKSLFLKLSKTISCVTLRIVHWSILLNKKLSLALYYYVFRTFLSAVSGKTDLSSGGGFVDSAGPQFHFSLYLDNNKNTALTSNFRWKNYSSNSPPSNSWEESVVSSQNFTHTLFFSSNCRHNKELKIFNL